MKSKMKIILYVFIILLMLLSLNTRVYADSTMGDVISSADDFLSQGSQDQTPITDDAVKSTSDLIYNVLLTLGTIVAVIWGIIIALKFITGSVEDKANIKETLIPYVVGCIIIFVTFWNVSFCTMCSNT